MRRIRTRLTALLAVPVLVVALAACGDDDGGSLSRDDAVSALAEGLGEGTALTDVQSRCLAERIIDDVGLERIIEAGLDSGGDVDQIDEGLQEELFTALFGALGPCEVDLTDLG